jgi:hypothetical protein
MSQFWKLFGVSLLVAFVIGIVVVPVQLYLEDRASRKEDKNVAE